MRATARALWVIDPSLATPEDQGVSEVLRDWPGPHRLFRPVLVEGDGPGPETGYEAGGVVLLGSASSVHDPSAWAERLSIWLRPILDGSRRMPLLGVCYGHQLIAHLAAGTVDFLSDDRTKQVGIETSELEGGRLLPGRHRLRVVVSHREHVTRAPEGYRVVAARPGIPVDGLEHPDLPIFSFQFHPEARDEFAGRAGIDPAAIDDRLRGDSARLLRAFRALASA